jgi:hypothetical protein
VRKNQCWNTWIDDSVESILENLDSCDVESIMESLETSYSYGSNVEFIERIAAVAAEIAPTCEFPYKPHLQRCRLATTFFEGYREMGFKLLEGLGDEEAHDRLFRVFLNRLCYVKSQSAAGTLV